MRFLRAWHPNDPACVVQTDLRDYYLRIPHPVLLALAEQLGMPERWRAFLARYLRVRVRAEGGPRVVKRGLLLDHLLGAVLAAAGSSLSKALKVTVYLADLSHFATVNGVYEQAFGGAKPARSTVQVAALPRGALIEVDVIALA